MWIRELPEPLLTFDLYDPFLATACKLFSLSLSLCVTLIIAAAIPDRDANINMIKKLLKMLPAAHYETTKYLVGFLHKVHLESSKNLMTAANLAVVFAPNLLRARSTCYIISACIQHFNSLFRWSSRCRCQQHAAGFFIFKSTDANIY